MEDEAKYLYIQQKINYLSEKNEANSKISEVVEMKSREMSSSMEGKVCGQIIQILDRNKRSTTQKRMYHEHKRPNETEFKVLGDGKSGQGIIFQRNSEKKSTPVSLELMNRLKTENLLQLSKNSTTTEMHDPKKCEACKKQEAKLAEYEFLKRHKTRIESALLDRKIDDVLWTRDTVMMIGDIARTLPKPSEDPEIIWRKLMKK